MTGKNDSGTMSPIVFYYFNMTGTESFRKLLEEAFRQNGHMRPIEFREWNCCRDLPGTDGDLYAYDCVVMSALAHKKYIRPVPDAVSAGDVFPWLIDKGRVRNKLFGVPIMLCCNALFCRKKDDLHIQSIMELNERTAIPLRSMLMYYCLQAICTSRSGKTGIKVMDHLLDLIGGRDYLEDSRSSDYDGIRRFNNEECRYFLGFTESMKYFKKDDYAVSFPRFSYSETNENKYFMADFVSLGKSIADDKLQDCTDLIRIMTDEQFIYDVCTLDGQLQYLLPANRSVFPRLAETDPIYDQFYSLIGSGENSILRYGKYFYETFYQKGDILLQFLWEKAGRRP